MKVSRTEIPDVCLIEPRVFGDARGFFYESFNQRRLPKLRVSRPNSCRTTIPAPPAVCCAACITKFSNPRENWCAWCRARYLTWRSIFAARRQPLGSGWARFCLSKTRRSSGCLRALPTALSCCPSMRSFCTRLLTTMHPSMSSALPGTTLS